MGVGGRYAIVNLQPPPYDDGVKLLVRGRVDDVMRGLMERLGYGANEKDWDCGNSSKNADASNDDELSI